MADVETPRARPAAITMSHSSVLETSTVLRGRAAGGHRSGVVVPETPFSAIGWAARSARPTPGEGRQGAVGGHDRHPLLVAQQLRAEPGGGHRAAQQGHVHRAAGQPGRAVVDAEQLQRDAGPGLVPAAQQRNGVVAERRPGVAEAQRPAARAAGVEGGLDGGEGDGGLVAEGVAMAGELQVVGGAVDEPGAQVVLQLPQGPRERGLAQPEPRGGTGHVALVGDGEERPQMPQLDGHASGA
ncbi:hypothetical protein SALBM135S_01282 [Streptomyces alboniger]